MLSGDAKIIKATSIKPLALFIVMLQFVLFSLLAASRAYAGGVPLNFQPANPHGLSWTSTTSGFCVYDHCGSNIGNQDPTPFGEEIVTIDSVNYFHVIVGDPTTGFAQEYYTRAQNVCISCSGQINFGSYTLDGGGMERSVIGNDSLASVAFTHDTSNAANPLSDYHVSGTGSQDPTHMAFRMVMTSATGDMALDVSKPFLDKKPKISQTVQSNGVTSAFATDMRAIGYSDNTTAAPVINTLTVNDPSIPGSGAANFSMEKSQQSVITAGRYTFDKPANFGWDTTDGWNSTDSTFVYGSYNYVDGQGFQPLTFDWTTVFDYAQNANACSDYVSSSSNQYSRDLSGNFGGSCFNKP